MKKIIYALLILLILPITLAQEICGDGAEINTGCTMLTPELTSCDSYTYEIFNRDSDLIESDSLSVFNNDIYYFNFTQGEGEYAVRLCDGAVREVFVLDPPEIEFYLYAISLLIFILLIGFGYYSEQQIFMVVGGFFGSAIALSLYLNGFPNVTDTFLTNSLSVIIAGISFYYMVAPFIEEFESWKFQREEAW